MVLETKREANEVLEIINKYKRDSLNFILGDVNNHCNKGFRMPNDNWYMWTDNLIKSLTNNKETMKFLLKKDGHEKITDMCRNEGGFLWNNENVFSENGVVFYKFNAMLKDLETQVDNEFIVRWCKLKRKSTLQIISERYIILEEIDSEKLKNHILKSKKIYFKHKKEKYDIVNKYYAFHDIN